MKIDSAEEGDNVYFKNFMVLKESDNFYGVYKCTIWKEKLKPLITSGETLNAACKKTKLLQIGYDLRKEE